MPRTQKDPLRPLTEEERAQLEQIARAQSWPAAQVARAKALLAVADGRAQSWPAAQVARAQAWPAAQVARAKALLAVADGRAFTQAARAAGRKSGDAVGTLVARFNAEGLAEGLAAVVPGHGGGPPPLYGVTERECILACARRAPGREQDGTATWSLSTLQQALRPEMPTLSTYTVWCVLLVRPPRGGPVLAEEPGLGRRRHRPAPAQETGRPHGSCGRHRPGRRGGKKLIEDAHRLGASLGLAVWNEDEAGPYQAIPQPGASWQAQGKPERQPHESYS